MTSPDFILRVLALIGRYEDHDSLWWRTDGKYAPVTFFIRCNDFFWWACADLEIITPDNIDVLEQSYKDVEAIDKFDVSWGSSLFCARVRKMRPQGACYPKSAEIAALFDACGPEREVGFGNPKAQPTYE